MTGLSEEVSREIRGMLQPFLGGQNEILYTHLSMMWSYDEFTRGTQPGMAQYLTTSMS